MDEKYEVSGNIYASISPVNGAGGYELKMYDGGARTIIVNCGNIESAYVALKMQYRDYKLKHENCELFIRYKTDEDKNSLVMFAWGICKWMTMIFTIIIHAIHVQTQNGATIGRQDFVVRYANTAA